jgi:hypothetical protein
MSDAPLRAQDVRFVEEARGYNSAAFELSPDDPAVYNGMDLEPQSTACMRGAAFDDNCFYSWSWDMTKCTDMMPFSVQGLSATGTWMQISSLAASRGIQVGTTYKLYFGRVSPGSECLYALHTSTGYRERGVFNYTRLMRADPNDGTGGANKQATIEFAPHHHGVKPWGSIWIARERFSGSLQSPFGIATFTIWEQERPNNPCIAGGASNPNPTLFGLSDFK